MTPFTDEDLTRLKKMLDPKGAEAIVGWNVYEWRALLSRLKAAETVCHWTPGLSEEDSLQRKSAWRKSKGEGK